MRLIERHRTALHRISLSRPVRQAIDDGLIDSSGDVFDYGCGRGGDVSRLRVAGLTAHGWDPAFAPDEPLRDADVVNLGYVVNVIEDPHERAAALRKAWSLTRRVLVVAGRLTFDSKSLSGAAWSDGLRTSRQTFQRLYTQEELREWIDSTLQASSVAAAPGIFYVFRRPEDAQTLLATRFRRRVVISRAERLRAEYEAHREVLDELVAFMVERGRPPRPDEEGPAAVVRAAVGSVQHGVAIVSRTIADESWQRITLSRAQDLLVYLALARFGGRARMSDLPVATQHDVKAFYGSYREACGRADRLLFAAGKPDAVDLSCRASTVGKLTRSALYVHVATAGSIPAVLRVFEGCARVLAGKVPDVTLVKLHRRDAIVSYLGYPTFDREPHPPLNWSLVCDLTARRLGWRSYADRDNPPVLHRKELFVDNDYPRRALFARLTAAEERAGLLDDSERIGTSDGWQSALAAKQLVLRGHRLARCPAQDADT